MIKKNLHILAIGDCNTSGLGEYSVPVAFTEKLKKSGAQCSLDNLGEAMLTSREGLSKIRDYRSHTDILLLNFGLVDTWITSIPGVYISYHPDNRLKKHARKILKSFKKRLRHPLFRRLLPSGPVVPIAEFTENIQAILDTAVQINPDIRIIIWGSAPTDDADRNSNLQKYDRVLAELATTYGVFVDTPRILAGHDRGRIFQDSVHLSRNGCELVANAMCDALSPEPASGL